MAKRSKVAFYLKTLPSAYSLPLHEGAGGRRQKMTREEREREDELDRLLPAPASSDELLVGGEVEGSERVRLVVGCDVEDRLDVVTTDHVDTDDLAVVTGSINAGTSEEVLAGSLEAGVETWAGKKG